MDRHRRERWNSHAQAGGRTREQVAGSPAAWERWKTAAGASGGQRPRVGQPGGGGYPQTVLDREPILTEGHAEIMSFGMHATRWR